MAKTDKATGAKPAGKTDDKPVRKADGKPAKSPKSGKPNFFARVGKYFADVRSEMKRVVWPTRTEVINSSGIVITTLIIFMVLILLFDQVSTWIMNLFGKI